jgi:hypothetical protein
MSRLMVRLSTSMNSVALGRRSREWNGRWQEALVGRWR